MPSKPGPHPPARHHDHLAQEGPRSAGPPPAGTGRPHRRAAAAQLALATGHPGDARAHIAAALAISVRDDLWYGPKACSVGIAAEAACPAPDPGTVEALTTRLSDIEAAARSFGGQLLAEEAAFTAMARVDEVHLSRLNPAAANRRIRPHGLAGG
jgi:hypothetical protein